MCAWPVTHGGHGVDGSEEGECGLRRALQQSVVFIERIHKFPMREVGASSPLGIRKFSSVPNVHCNPHECLARASELQ